MRLKWIAFIVIGFAALQSNAQEPTALKTQKDRISYMVGVQIAGNLKSQGMDVDPNLVAAGLRDALSGAKILMGDDEIRATMTVLQQEMTQKQAQLMAQAAETNKKAGEVFLAENAKKPGVVTQPSGLQYKIVKAAEGKKPAQSDTIICNYRGTLIDGKEFDSSYTTGSPATFQVGGLIPGVAEALQLMPVGSTWQFFIPSGLAYAERGAGDAIGPNATLIFEIDLISIK